MRLRVAADGDTIELASELKAVTVSAVLALWSVAVLLVLNWTHPFSSLECVRHEYSRGGASKVSAVSSQSPLYSSPPTRQGLRV